MTHAPRISVIIPVFNQWAMTRACLESLSRHWREELEGPFEVVVADNASSDETPREAQALGQALFPGRFTLARHEANLGFSAACNLGAARARGSFLFFLNNDTEAMTPGLGRLAGLLESTPDLTGTGPLLTYPGDVRVQHLGIASTAAFKGQHYHHLVPLAHPLTSRRRRFFALTGAALMLRARDFRAARGFFEGYRNGYEDLDLALTLGRGRAVFTVDPDVRLIHHTSATPGRFDREAANFRLFQSRHPAGMPSDIGRLAAEDGLELSFNEWFEAVLSLPGPRSLELVREAQDQNDLDFLHELVLREPYWAEGYELVCELLESSGLAAQSLPLRALQTNFQATLASIGAHRRCAEMAGDRAALAEADTVLARARSRMGQPGLEDVAAATLAQARKNGDAPTLAACKLWFAARRR